MVVAVTAVVTPSEIVYNKDTMIVHYPCALVVSLNIQMLRA
jgi:hypothetical protein